MALGLTPDDRLAYDTLRTQIAQALSRYSIAQRVVADEVGVKQSTISSALAGRTTSIVSIVTLAQIARVILPMLPADDQRRLQDDLARVVAIVRRDDDRRPQRAGGDP
jgi:hypothetical protein